MEYLILLAFDNSFIGSFANFDRMSVWPIKNLISFQTHPSHTPLNSKFLTHVDNYMLRFPSEDLILTSLTDDAHVKSGAAEWRPSNFGALVFLSCQDCFVLKPTQGMIVFHLRHE